MKFTVSVDVDLPPEKVVGLWQEEANLKHWQDGYIDSTPVSGEPGAVGSKTLMRYTIRNKVMELEETILKNDLPKEFQGRYAAKQMSNTMTSWFEEYSSGKTRWTSEIHYTEMNGFMVKLMAKLFPGMFRKQTQTWLNNFKVFAESQP